MQKTIKNLIVGAALFNVAAISAVSFAADEPKPTASTEQTYESLDVPSGTYVMDKTHGYVTFSYSHKGLSHPVLRFNDVDATLVLDAAHPENSQIDVSILAANIDSGVAKLDAHLNSADFLDTENNPKITFKTTSFTRDGATSGKMIGDLTMMGVTKSVSFDVVLVGTADGKNPTIGVEGNTSILRSEYNLGKFVPYVGDKVSISISAEFNKAD